MVYRAIKEVLRIPKFYKRIFNKIVVGGIYAQIEVLLRC